MISGDWSSDVCSSDLKIFSAHQSVGAEFCRQSININSIGTF